MKFIEIIEEEDGRMMAVNTCDWDGNECEEMQLTISQHDNRSFIDLSKDEARILRDKITEWIGA